MSCECHFWCALWIAFKESVRSAGVKIKIGKAVLEAIPVREEWKRYAVFLSSNLKYIQNLKVIIDYVVMKYDTNCTVKDARSYRGYSLVPYFVAISVNHNNQVFNLCIKRSHLRTDSPVLFRIWNIELQKRGSQENNIIMIKAMKQIRQTDKKGKVA